MGGYVTIRGLKLPEVKIIMRIAKSGKVALTINRHGHIIGYKIKEAKGER